LRTRYVILAKEEDEPKKVNLAVGPWNAVVEVVVEVVESEFAGEYIYPNWAFRVFPQSTTIGYTKSCAKASAI
jgi:hypothetical protein